MDEGSSDNMDEAGIPMLVSEYNITVQMVLQHWMRKSISIDGRGGHSHARIKIHEDNCEPQKEGPLGYIGTAVYIISVQRGHKSGTYC